MKIYKHVFTVVLAMGLVVEAGFAAPLQTKTVTGLLNTDDLPDKLIYSYVPGEDEPAYAKIEIFLASANGIGRKVSRNYNMSESYIAITSKSKGVIAVFESGETGGSAKETFYFNYNDKAEDWFLVKSVSESDTRRYMDLADYTPLNINVHYYPGMKGLGGNSIEKSVAVTESEKDRIDRSLATLKHLHDELMAKYKMKTLSKSALSEYDVRDLAELIKNVPITEENVELYNNIGFFFQQNKESVLNAVYILGEVVEKCPDRTAAYVNLADAYYDIDEQERAKVAYSKYVELAKRDGKEKNIPRRVWERLR